MKQCLLRWTIRQNTREWDKRASFFLLLLNLVLYPLTQNWHKFTVFHTFLKSKNLFLLHKKICFFFWEKTFDHHLGASPKKQFVCQIFPILFSFYMFFQAKNMKKACFDQHCPCTAPKHYTGQNIQQPCNRNCYLVNLYC